MPVPARPGLLSSANVRRSLVESLRLDLIGPVPGAAELADEVLPQTPSRWYLTGFLVPLHGDDAQVAPEPYEDMDAGTDAGGADDASSPDLAGARRARLPSSMGLSILLPQTAASLKATVSWGDYNREDVGEGGRAGRWRRTPRTETLTIDLVAPGENGIVRHALSAGAGLEVVRLVRDTRVRDESGDRPVRAVSLFVVNRRAPRDDERADEACVFQVVLDVESETPLVPRFDLRGHDGEEWDERLADLHYRDCAEFAVGHNTSTHATVEADGSCRRVRTEWMPEAAVERVIPAEIKGVEFEMEALGALPDGAAAASALSALPRLYRDWIAAQPASLGGLSRQRREVAEHLLERAEIAAKRIEEGIALLSDSVVLDAFRTANRAMAAAARRRVAIEQKRKPDAVDPPKWHPFQLAFILLNLKGLVDPTHGDRETVDLLFFPTGGGKTEAYLGLAAFTMVLRRLRNPGLTSAGVSVLMRYTLRLLTLDQLGRAAALVCALELEREKEKQRLGEWPFEIGLWVGRAATPNRMGAKGNNDPNTARLRVLHYAGDGRVAPPLPIEQCPWCGTPFNKASFQLWPNADKPLNLNVRCVNRDCDFTRNRWLPILGVDEPIYRRLPAFMIATVDKFAAMPWTGEVGAFFGGADRHDANGFYGPATPGVGNALPSPLPPPDLVIQDELHLISGPLGTIAGLYETALDQLCTGRAGGKPVRPKIVASTATVRRAERQIRALFDRRAVEVFPPPGPNRRDSFFARQQPASEGEPRLYLGVAAQGRGPKVLFLRTMVSLMSAAQRAWEEGGGEASGAKNPADPYMSVVAYFNALRELGSARRIVEDEVGSRLRNYSTRVRVGEEPGRFRDRQIAYEVLELTSRESTSKVAETKRKLAQPFADRQERVDVALATNMISVGLDITRLGLMLVSGQPKTTAEYIQATSRVGRDPTRPGLVITLLNVHKPRDRSHYERFGAYHASFYRSVEATSVTPFSPRALDRALAATTVALARLSVPDLTPQKGAAKAAELRSKLDEVVAAIAGRAERHGGTELKPEERSELGAIVRKRVADLLDEWARLADDYTKHGTTFGYQGDKTVSKGLLHDMLDQGLNPVEQKFRAPRSMRDVEPNVLLGIRTPDEREFEDAGA